eukprot:TRINITY_DN19830_c0_g1_i1.p1 TRINITY_DN19830_c0_g1~~TRINITY_DN19830_c0_g1_i1.p1  ORF type:complete len:312 (+),score=41.01 TRINITY_DN19830_c0_g1_i1:89-1024(+)
MQNEQEMSIRNAPDTARTHNSDAETTRSLALEDAEGLEHGIHEDGEEIKIIRWEDQEIPEDVKDIQFLVFWLSRRNKIHDRHRGLLIQCVFLIFFTIALLQHFYPRGYYLVTGVGDVVATGEWDQGPSTGLYFEKTFADVQQVSDWWSWVKSAQSMQSLYGNDNVTYQGQNRIMPDIIRFSQRRVKSIESRCASADDLVDGRFRDYFDGCWAGYGYTDENTHGFVEKETYDYVCPALVNVTNSTDSVWPCGCDGLFRSGFVHSRQDIDGFAVTVPSLVRSIPDWVGRFATYSTHSYYFDTYADDTIEGVCV